MIEAMLTGGGMGAIKSVQRLFSTGSQTGVQNDLAITPIDPGKTVAFGIFASYSSASANTATKISVFPDYIRLNNHSRLFPYSVEVVEFSGSAQVTHDSQTLAQGVASLDVSVDEFDPSSSLIFLTWYLSSATSDTQSDLSMLYEVVDSTTIRLHRFNDAQNNDLDASIQIARL